MSDIIRISEQGKRQLIGLKRTTKIDQWNILCRWALCSSLQDQTPLRQPDLGPMSNVEMTWATFCSQYQPCIYGLLKLRWHCFPAEQEFYMSIISLGTAHIHRGITSLAHKKPNVTDVVTSPLREHPSRPHKNTAPARL